MGVIAEGILRGCQGLFTPVSLGYPLSVFNKNSTLKQTNKRTNISPQGDARVMEIVLQVMMPGPSGVVSRSLFDGNTDSSN